MYNLAQREGLPILGDTPNYISANTYIFDENLDYRKNTAPFLSTKERDSALGRKLFTHALYDAQVPRHIPGGCSIRNKAKRFEYKEDDTPGPTHYDPKKYVKKPPHVPNTPPPGKGKLYLCSVPHHHQAVGPSIPTTIDENGYCLDDNGKLIKIPPDYKDRSVGPAYYNVSTKPCITTRLYKGCAWSKRRAKRKTIEVSDNPGPADYDVRIEERRLDPRDEYVREMARLYSYVPRSLEAAAMRTLKEDLPGPGHYEFKPTTLREGQSIGINPPKFIAGAPRFKSAATAVPSPDRYKICDCSTKHKQFSTKDTLFGFEALRFPPRRKSTGPGPAEYDVPNGTISDRVNKKQKIYSTAEAPFNITAIRKLTFVEDDAPFMPGPANYLLEPIIMEKTPIDCCHFKSRTDRFPELPMSEDADPATYSISATFNKNRNRTSHNTGKVPFQSTQPKCMGQRVPDNPSSADYLCHGGFGGRNLYFNKTPRYKDAKEDFPGPGAYHIPPALSDSLHHKSVFTHNLRLKENVLRTKLRLPTGKTWESWFKELHKKKKLKWFADNDAKNCNILDMMFS